MITTENQNHLNLHHKKKKNLIKQKYAIFMKRIQLQKCQKLETTVILLVSTVVQLIIIVTYNVENL